MQPAIIKDEGECDGRGEITVPSGILNRIDEIIVFHSLTIDHMKKIVGLMCKELIRRVKNQMNITLTIRDSAKIYCGKGQ